MLRTMREDFKKYSWTLWLIMLSFVGGFIITDAFRGGDGRSEDGLIFIGDTTIKSKQYQDELLNTLGRYKQQMKENFNKQMIQQFGLTNNVLQQMISRTIVQTEALKYNITASDEELKDKIVNHPSLQYEGKFIGLPAYHRVLQQNKIQVEDFEAGLRQEIAMKKLQDIITSGLVMDNDTLLEKFKTEKENAEIEYILLKPDKVKETIEATDEEIQAHYDKNKENFKSKEKRSGYAVVLKFDDYKKDVSADQKAIYDYFKANKSQFSDPAKTKVSRIYLKHETDKREEGLKQAEALQAQLTKENFADKAKELSQDDKAKNGGDYGYFAWNSLTKQEKAIIGALDQDEISSPVGTGEGFAIFLITEKKEKSQKELAKVQNIIKDTLEKQRLDKLVQEKLEGIYAKLKDAEDFKAQAEKLGVAAVETGMLARNDAVKDLEDSGHVSRQLFQLKDKELSAPTSFAKGMVIARLDKIEEPKIEPLENVKDKVKAAAISAKKVEKLMVTAQDISNGLNGLKSKEDKDVEEYLKGKDLTKQTLTYKKGDRLSYLKKKGLDDLIFGMEENTFSEPIDMDREVAIVKVKSKTIIKAEDFEKEKDQYYTQQLKQLKSSYFNAYVSNKRTLYNVRINQDLYEKVTNSVVNRFN